MSKDRKTVRVSCAHPGGLELRVFEPKGPRDLETGERSPVQVDVIKLKGPSALHAGAGDPSASSAAPVLNDGVDAEVMQAWIDQNVNSPLAELFTVHDDEPQPKADE